MRTKKNKINFGLWPKETNMVEVWKKIEELKAKNNKLSPDGLFELALHEVINQKNQIELGI